MKWLFLVTLTLLAASAFSAAFDKEEDGEFVRYSVLLVFSTCSPE